MAEMTAREAVEILKDNAVFDDGEFMRIAALIEQQAATIAELRSIEAGAAYLNDQQAQEIERKGKMLKNAVTGLDNGGVCAIAEGMPDNMQHCDNAGGNYSCTDCWLAWLEQQVKEGDK